MREAALAAVPMRPVVLRDEARAFLSLDVAGLSLVIDGTRLIDIDSLRLGGGGITMLMGPNGAGKSLLLRLLHGLIAPTAGEVRWGGRPLSPQVMRRQALVFQKPVLLRRSVAANVDFVLRARGLDAGRTRSLLERVGLADKGRRPARLLSGGEQQRLAMARALAVEPDVILLDEPTASLDPASVHAIETLVRETARQGTRILFVTHDIGQARRLADDVVFLNLGQVSEHAPADRFFSNPQSEAARAYLSGNLMF